VKQEIAKQWCEALRSGKYKQGKGALKRDGSFCCLGVLCDISGISKWNDYSALNTYLGRDGILPESVQEWAGMGSQLGELPVAPDLSELNDGNNDEHGKTFAEIADIIEKNWEVL
jgi:hypothetical protein